MLNNSIKNILLNKKRNYVLITQVINTLIGLVAGKLIAIYILPKDFGSYNIQFATYTFFATLLISPFLQFVKSTNNSLLPKIGSKYYLYTIGGIVFACYIFLFTFLYAVYQVTDWRLYLILILIIPLTALSSLLGDYLTLKNKLITFSKFSVIKSFSSLLFIATMLLLSISWFTHVELLWMMQLSGVIIGLTVFIKHYKYFKAKVVIAYATFFKKYYRFSGPLMFLALWSWINNYFDRYALEYFLGLHDVGIYNASYGVGSKFFLLLSPIFMILLTPQVYALVKTKIKKKAIKTYGLYYIMLGAVVLAVIFMLKDFIGGLLLSANYKDGFYLIFWIALAFFILTLTHIFESVFYAESKTQIILYANIVAAIINIIANIVLIPILGIMGAAMATCISFSIHFLVIYFNFKKL